MGDQKAVTMALWRAVNWVLKIVLLLVEKTVY